MAISRYRFLSAQQQRDLVETVNRAYDQGGAAAMQILADTVNNLAKDNPEYEESFKVFSHIIEGVREALAEAVRTAIPSLDPDAPPATEEDVVKVEAKLVNLK